MASPSSSSGRLDRWAIWLSAACVVHCVAATVLVATLSTAGALIGSPLIHELGLFAALLLAVVAFGQGLLTHRRALPTVLGAAGLVTMGGALLVSHEGGHQWESVLTIAGVVLLASGHALNHRARA